MRVLKITAEGPTTSFRYPHFMQQIHPSFQMPPPTTIYGHICSVLGTWVDPTGLSFACHFTYQDTVRDIEHTIVLSPSSGKLPDTQYAKVLEGAVNPFEREVIFQPRLILYLNRPEWESYFRSPHYAVVLGRSQDLFTYTRIDVMELEQADRAYFEHTLAPYAMALRVMQGITVLMPRFLDYDNKRAPSFGQYLILKERVLLKDDTFWVDPTTPEVDQAHLGLFFHRFTGDAHETLSMA